MSLNKQYVNTKIDIHKNKNCIFDFNEIPLKISINFEVINE